VANGNETQTRSIRLTGQVQGVGFRPFVYRLAVQHGVQGWVQNQLGEVEVLAEAPAEQLDAFQNGLIADAPPLARPALGEIVSLATTGHEAFLIRDSEARRKPEIHVPPDYFTCDDCVSELNDPDDRRYRYPFINCTQCGPRYTLIQAMPYDRPNTSMAGFPLCPQCQSEYEDPLDRRFHAEPVACPVCGPALSFRDKNGDTIPGNEKALAAALEALRDGAILAVKGVGGYHLMCDACNDQPIARLRASKPRPDKPLAVMFPATGTQGLDAVSDAVDPQAGEYELLTSPDRPIVLMSRTKECSLSPLIAPGLREVGVMLPYSPLHHLLLGDFGGPLIATSGNISGEPVLTDAVEVEERLAGMVDGYLHHDRPIVRPADDSVFRRIGNGPKPIRLGRGTAPLEFELPMTLPTPTLAVGGHMKNTIALAWGDRLVVSPHIGDMGTTRSLTVFERVVTDLQELYGITAKAIVCDAHPHYVTNRWAHQQKLPVHTVLHHHAHASAAAMSWQDETPGVVFTWDGVGYGSDGKLWGGEALVGQPGHWRRAGSMRPFRLPGGERAGREPWRSAAALCWESGRTFAGLPDGAELARVAWERNMNCPTTTAVGRLFDAASALLGLVVSASFEGQGPMILEAQSGCAAGGIELPLYSDDNGCLMTDWEPLLDMLSDASLSIAVRAAAFHDTMALALVAQARRLRTDFGVKRVALSGGVFQNRLLTDRCFDLLKKEEFDLTQDGRLPVNDGGLSAGQIIEFAARAT
jgi:hydrogenase maturation protein HypF